MEDNPCLSNYSIIQLKYHQENIEVHIVSLSLTVLVSNNKYATQTMVSIFVYSVAVRVQDFAY
jgi:hypothetical protein